MRGSTKRAALLAAGIIVVAGAAALARMVFLPGALDFASGHQVSLADFKGPSPTGVPKELANAALLERGAYLTAAADCQACHTAEGGPPYAGGRPFKLPFGTLYTPNITPDAETGIGRWSDADFLKAVHKGVAPGGRRLYPAFPYASYTLMTDEDVLAIKAYLFSLAPVRRENLPDTFAFPYNQRWLMIFWGLLFNPDHRFMPVAERGPEWNRGAYLVEGAAHCGECHTPRTPFQAMDTRRKFAGGQAEGWNAYNITPDVPSGIGGWSAEQIEAYLAHGHAKGKSVASGPMREAVELSFSKLSPSDIAAMRSYLQTVPAVHTSLPAPAGPAPREHGATVADNLDGKRMFEGACASCHAWSGAGVNSAEAQLTAKRALNDPSAANVALMILKGSGPQVAGRPYMPGFSGAYSDEEIAAVANYVTARFGAAPSKITPGDVAKLRLE
ncbi:cytochrome c [Nitrospirillum viridazoti]|uniref:Mono/diheme cytochrome c family protein n=1 Tax=Nitrospirillum amazonense TaxID=28077 RepID=A0A560IS10_9PROT|nr:cytochrome c [Nitrospirillum amazonense]TWB59380.1 mono/diheme cytochrome c family protein [Nitrospirillum amazonense]